jgi:hypothetical protein
VEIRGRLCGRPLLHALLLRLQRSRWRPATYQPRYTTRRPPSACADEQRQAMGVVALLLGECRTEGEAVDVAPRREVRFPRARA